MKCKFVKRTLACLMTLVMLIPMLATVPMSASAQGEAIELFNWTAQSPCELNMSAVKDNLIRAATRSWTHYVQSLKVYGKDGVAEKNQIFYYLLDSCAPNTQSTNYGLPRAEDAKGANAYEHRATEGLKLQFTQFEPIPTTGKAAVNLKMTYALTTELASLTLHGVDKFDVLVSKDGQNWLPEGAGLRSWELIGHSFDAEGRVVYIFSLETENFLDIDGLNPGDTIVDIMVRPHGNYFLSTGRMIMSDVTVNGYATQEDWETLVPDERSDMLQLGEEKMRDIVIARADAISDIAWTSDTTIYTDAVIGTDYSGTGGTVVKEFVEGIEYHGPMYSRAVKVPYEFLRNTVVDGVYVGGRTTGVCAGTDCTGYVYDAISLVSRTSSWRLWESQNDKYMVLLGDIKKTDTAVFTSHDIININDAQTIYEGYAQLQRGDVLTTFTTTGAIPPRMAHTDAVVVRTADGTIDPVKSYVPCAEETDYMWYFFEKPDGTRFWEPLNSRSALEGFLLNYPQYKLLYGSNSPKTDFTFQELINGSYAPWTIKEYLTGEVENVDVQMLLHPTDYEDMTKGFTGVLASDYHMNKYGLKLEDLDRGTVLFEDEQYLLTQRIKSTAVFYTNEKLDARLAELTDGNYRISMYVQAGPITQVGADRPITTQSVDFTVSGKEATAKVELQPSASAVTKGQTVTMDVTSSVAAKAADVKVKFDTQLLSYVDGSVAQAGLGSVTCTGNIVRIMSAKASSGTKVATLTFTAQQDIANVADVVTVLSASVVPTSGGNAIKASGSNDCPSAYFTDVDQSAWYHDAVDFALENSIMGGYNASTFGPNDNLSRAMVVQVLYNKEGQPTISGSHTFPDVKAGDWFNNAVTWANLNKVVGGYGDGTFQPNKNVSLQEVAVILWNYSGNPTPTGDASSVGVHDDWAANALSWAVGNGIFEGMPYDTVTGTASRAQTAQMLMNFLSK